MRPFIAFLLLCCVSCTAVATSELRAFVSGGYEIGGDTIIAGVKAGGGAYLGGGLEIAIPRSRVSINGTIGYMFSNTNYWGNQEVSYTVVPAELTIRYRMWQTFFGIGLAQHINPEFTQCEILHCQTVSPDDPYGLVALYGVTVEKHIFVNVKYTNMEYNVDCRCTLDANSIGFYAGYRW